MTITMKVIILAGGKSLRYNNSIPKSLAIIGNKPIIHHIMDIYSNQGYNDFIIALGYKKEYIIDYFAKSNEIKNSKLNINFADTGEDSNTGHRVKLLENLLDNENFFCTYSDGLANIDLKLLLRHHSKLNSICTLTAVRPYNQYGVLKLDYDGRVLQFIEKPRMNEYINGGFFIFKNSIFDHITGNNEDLELDILPRLSYEGKLGAYKHEEYWDTINTLKDELRIGKLYNEYKSNNRPPPWTQIRQHTIDAFLK